MNPLISEWIGSLVRKGLAFVAGFLIVHGWITDSLAGRLTEAAVPLAISVVWTLWVKYKDRLKIVTALSLTTPVSEKQLERIIDDPTIPNPSATTPKTEIPPASTGAVGQ